MPAQAGGLLGRLGFVVVRVVVVVVIAGGAHHFDELCDVSSRASAPLRLSQAKKASWLITSVLQDASCFMEAYGETCARRQFTVVSLWKDSRQYRKTTADTHQTR